MDKLLDFVVAYIKEILDKKNLLQWLLLGVVGCFLGGIAIYGYLDKGQNGVLKSMAEFSFYTCVVMILLGIIGIGGRNKEEQELEKLEDYLNIFEKDKSQNLINYFNKNKKILVVYKKPRKYEINVWLEDDKYFGKIYIYFIDSKLKEKALNIKILEQDKNEGYEDCLNYKENSKINTPIAMKEAVNELIEKLEDLEKSNK